MERASERRPSSTTITIGIIIIIKHSCLCCIIRRPHSSHPKLLVQLPMMPLTLEVSLEDEALDVCREK